MVALGKEESVEVILVFLFIGVHGDGCGLIHVDDSGPFERVASILYAVEVCLADIQEPHDILHALILRGTHLLLLL
jgi:hypothetical protein